MTARLTRVLTGHCPIGDFRTDYHLEGITICPCSEKKWNRSHTILRCPLFYRKNIFSHRTDLMKADPYHEIALFLEKNPTAFTFEFSEIYERMIQRERIRGPIEEIIHQFHCPPILLLDNRHLYHILTERILNPEEIDQVIEQHTRPPGHTGEKFYTTLTIKNVQRIDKERRTFFKKVFEPTYRNLLAHRIDEIRLDYIGEDDRLWAKSFTSLRRIFIRHIIRPLTIHQQDDELRRFLFEYARDHGEEMLEYERCCGQMIRGPIPRAHLRDLFPDQVDEGCIDPNGAYRDPVEYVVPISIFS